MARKVKNIFLKHWRNRLLFRSSFPDCYEMFLLVWSNVRRNVRSLRPGASPRHVGYPRLGLRWTTTKTRSSLARKTGGLIRTIWWGLDPCVFFFKKRVYDILLTCFLGPTRVQEFCWYLIFRVWKKKTFNSCCVWLVCVICA